MDIESKATERFFKKYKPYSFHFMTQSTSTYKPWVALAPHSPFIFELTPYIMYSSWSVPYSLSVINSFLSYSFIVIWRCVYASEIWFGTKPLHEQVLNETVWRLFHLNTSQTNTHYIGEGTPWAWGLLYSGNSQTSKAFRTWTNYHIHKSMGCNHYIISGLTNPY